MLQSLRIFQEFLLTKPRSLLPFLPTIVWTLTNCGENFRVKNSYRKEKNILKILEASVLNAMLRCERPRECDI